MKTLVYNDLSAAEVLFSSKRLCVDVETDPHAPEGSSFTFPYGLSYLSDITFLSVYGDADLDRVFVFSMPRLPSSLKPSTPLTADDEDLLAFVRRLLTLDDVMYIGHNAVFDLRSLCGHLGVTVRPTSRVWDTMVLAARLMMGVSGEQSPHSLSLDDQVRRFGWTNVFYPDDDNFYRQMKNRYRSSVTALSVDLDRDPSLFKPYQDGAPDALTSIYAHYVAMDTVLTYYVYRQQSAFVLRVKDGDTLFGGVRVPKWPDVLDLVRLETEMSRECANQAALGVKLDVPYVERRLAEYAQLALDQGRAAAALPDPTHHRPDWERVYCALLFYEAVLGLLENGSAFPSFLNYVEWIPPSFSADEVRQWLTPPAEVSQVGGVFVDNYLTEWSAWLSRLDPSVKRAQLLKSAPTTPTPSVLSTLEFCLRDMGFAPKAHRAFLAQVKDAWFRRRFTSRTAIDNPLSLSLFKPYHLFVVCRIPLPTDVDIEYNWFLVTTKVLRLAKTHAPAVDEDVEEDSLSADPFDGDFADAGWLIDFVKERDGWKVLSHPIGDLGGVWGVQVRSQPVSPNETAVSPNETAVSANETAVSPNETAVSPNETAVSPSETAVSANETAVSPNETAVSPSETAVSANETAVSPNETAVSANETAVSLNETAVSLNETAVSPSETAVSDEVERVYVTVSSNSLEGQGCSVTWAFSLNADGVVSFTSLNDDDGGWRLSQLNATHFRLTRPVVNAAPTTSVSTPWVKLAIEHNGFSTGKKAVDWYLAKLPEDHVVKHYRQAVQAAAWTARTKEFLQHAQRDGRIHSVIARAARTGRCTSVNPNLQNVDMVHFRGYLIPDSDEFVLLELDYANAENKTGAMVSGDNKFALSTESGDFHSFQARIYWPEEWRQAEEAGDKKRLKDIRRRSKAVTFASAYGAGAAKIAVMIGASKEEAQRILSNKALAYPVLEKRKRDAAFAVESRASQGFYPSFIALWDGSRVVITNRLTDSASFVEQTRRSSYKAWNYLQQGGVAQMVTRAIVAISRFLAENGFRTRVALNVHDSIILHAHVDEVDAVLPTICSIMGDVVPERFRKQTRPYVHFVAEVGPENATKWGYRDGRPYPLSLDHFWNRWGKHLLPEEQLSLPPEKREAPTWVVNLAEGDTLEAEVLRDRQSEALDLQTVVSERDDRWSGLAARIHRLERVAQAVVANELMELLTILNASYTIRFKDGAVVKEVGPLSLVSAMYVVDTLVARGYQRGELTDVPDYDVLAERVTRLEEKLRHLIQQTP